MDESSFFSEVCQGLGWEASPWRLAVFSEWHRHEGMDIERTHNPLATTWISDDTPMNLAFNVGYGPGLWNSVPVRVYRDAQSGIRATVNTLALGYYVQVRRCFADEAGYDEAVPELATYVGSWAYGQALVQFMKDQEVADPRIDQIIETLRVTGITEWQNVGNEPLRMSLGKIQSDIADIKQSLGQGGGGLDQIKLNSAFDTAIGVNNLLMQWRGMLAASGIIVP